MDKMSASHFAPEWVRDAIFYQIFPDRFCNGDPANDPSNTEPWGNPPTRENYFGGDLRGILNQLDYLQRLGVNALYLNPIFRARSNHKYDTWDYFEVDPSFGDNALLKELVRKLHQRGMYIILDGVFNHCGDGFWAFEDVRTQGSVSPFADWFIIRSYPLSSAPLNYETHGGAPDLPKFNHSHPLVREFLLHVATHWLRETGIDGWRLDSVCKVPVSFWRDFRTAVKTVNSRAYLVGEVWREAAPWVRGDTFDGVTNYRLRELMLDYCALGSLDAEDFAYEVETLIEAHGGAAHSMLNFLGNHDTPRAMTFFRGDVDRLLIAVTFLFTMIGAPMIYYGDEIGLCGDADPDCRRTMIWDETRWNRRIYEAYQSLIALRLSHRALRRGRLETLLTFNRVYAYRRVDEEDEVIILLNPGPAVSNIKVSTQSLVSTWQNAMHGEKYECKGSVLQFESLPATSAMLLVPVREQLHRAINNPADNLLYAS